LGQSPKRFRQFTLHQFLPDKEAAKQSYHRPLMPIVNKNLIYVGQTIVLPPRKINPPPGDRR
jgi:hypothetical protein